MDTSSKLVSFEFLEPINSCHNMARSFEPFKPKL